MSPLLPTVSVTTRHSASLYPWQPSCSLPEAGPVLGLNMLAGGTLFSYDPWECYAAGVVTSPNMVVLGQLGKGKSALVKTYLSRQLLAGRQAFVLDPKGEYAPLAQARALPRLTLSPGGADRLNPLDALPGDDADAVARRRAGVVAALASTGLGRDLFAEEKAAISAATADLDANPALPDVVSKLLEPPPQLAASLHTTPDALSLAVRATALELRRLLAGDLAGMVDAATTVTLDPDGPGVVVDLSAAFGSDALPAVMVCAGAWLAAAITRPSSRRRFLLVDEAWALLNRPATTAWLQAISKLARRHGVALITVVHRCSDLSGQADDGTAAQAQARGLLADAETRVVYGQPAGERAAAAELLDLSDTETELVTRLPAHRALWRVGTHTAVVEHVLTTDEADGIVDTDERMQS
jgi:type IV secretory pathway VirB4 component